MISSPFEYILFQSRLSPTAIAFETGSVRVTYAQFCTDIENVTRVLVAEGVQADQRVAVLWRDTYMHWLATIALMRIGATSVSVNDPTRELAFVAPSVVVSDQDIAGEGRRLVKGSRDWLGERAVRLPAFVDQLHPPDRLIRIVLSSGTTGVPKKVGLTTCQLYERGRGAVRLHGFNSTSRVTSLVGIDTMGGLQMPLYAWSGGACVVVPAGSGAQAGEQLLQSGANMVFTSPAQLANVLETLPPGYWAKDDIEVIVSGSILPTPLARRARLKLTPRVYILYGSTEAGTVSLAHAAAAEGRPGFAGHVLPPGPVEAVDETGRVLAPGEFGELRIRQEGMSTGYVDDSGADGAFRDGWFYPGDLGCIDRDGALIVSGRTSELMNFGGVKVSPNTIEEALAGMEGVVDIAAFAAPRPNGIEGLWIAVASRPGFDEAALRAEYRRALPSYPPATLVLMPDIPRNAMGKVMRGELVQRLKSASPRKPPATR